jgi:hypothetical protein
MTFSPGRHNLIAVLDWGIGHATRSLALAAKLEAAGESITFAAAGDALEILRAASPNREILELPAYDIHYRSSNMHWNVLRQLPALLQTIRKEKKFIDQLLNQRSFDRIISDSRFGCFSAKVPSVMLTHQLRPLFNLPLAELLYRNFLTTNFSEFWVPDQGGDSRLSGRLSDSTGYHNVQYIGPLSRLTPPAVNPEKSFTFVALLSGPEPQRTFFEEKLRRLLPRLPGHHLLVTGKTAAVNFPTDQRLKVVPYTNADQTAAYLLSAERVICRPGYSTLMDLDRLGVSVPVLVPTPGQTEQIYLAKRLAKAGSSILCPQKDLEPDTFSSVTGIATMVSK